MKKIYQKIIRPIFFCFSPEKAHNISFFFIKYFSWLFLKPSIDKTILNKRVMGIDFPNPVGLAAGFDKNGDLINKWHHLGFGFIEIGTVTVKPQEGNSKPRLFRLEQDQALINRMGFNNLGMEAMVKRLKIQRNKSLVVGVNIGKNTSTVDEKKIKEEYILAFKKLSIFADYITINISCPNIGDISILQENTYLKELLLEIQVLNNSLSKYTPILIKIAPHLSKTQLDDILQVIKETKIDGVVATNTSSRRENISCSKEKLAIIGKGGLSGKPIKEQADKVLAYLASKGKKSFAIIAVGGIMNKEDAIRKLELGADIVQLYTGFVYQGPSLINEIKEELITLLS